MKAHTPQELPLVFEHHLNAQDVAGLMADYYADDATYAPVPGQIVFGSHVASAIARLIALGKRIEVCDRPLRLPGAMHPQQERSRPRANALGHRGLGPVVLLPARHSGSVSLRCYTDGVPTTRRRHAITETPAVQAALDELRAELGSDGVDMADLVIRGAREKVAETRAADEGRARAREKLAQWVLAGDIPGDPAAALEARESWQRKLPGDART